MVLLEREFWLVERSGINAVKKSKLNGYILVGKY